MLFFREYILARFVLRVFPKVDAELKKWEKIARQCPDQMLRKLAVSSLQRKKFHCQGGSVFAVWAGANYQEELIRAIVALQTISDYLDNLCDRAGVQDEEGFRRLHLAFTDALCPGAAHKNYYSLYPYQQDGEYLNSLVFSCQQAISRLPSYATVKSSALEMAELYSMLQVLKHSGRNRRENCLMNWLNPYLAGFSHQIFWWELAAATGSTLGIFALLALAARPEPTADCIEKINGAYFPWIGGLHILLDYFIDQEEDQIEGDLNFVSYYGNSRETLKRLNFFLKQALERTQCLPEPFFHHLVVKGLLAMYFSDPKVAGQNLTEAADALLRASGADSLLLRRFCSILRRRGVI